MDAPRTAEHYRSQAERVRRIADTVGYDSEARQILLNIARQYEDLATMTERLRRE